MEAEIYYLLQNLFIPLDKEIMFSCTLMRELIITGMTTCICIATVTIFDYPLFLKLQTSNQQKVKQCLTVSQKCSTTP